MTAEEQARVDRALANTQLDARIGGASDFTGTPSPGDPARREKARDIGQDLHKSGVTMDRE